MVRDPEIIHYINNWGTYPKYLNLRSPQKTEWYTHPSFGGLSWLQPKGLAALNLDGGAAEACVCKLMRLKMSWAETILAVYFCDLQRKLFLPVFVSYIALYLWQSWEGAPEPDSVNMKTMIGGVRMIVWKAEKRCKRHTWEFCRSIPCQQWVHFLSVF